jgi:hypothetical protein
MTLQNAFGDLALDSTLTDGSQKTQITNPTADPETGLAKEATLGERYSGGKLAKTALVTAVGVTSVLSPSAGKSLKLYWVTAINDPAQALSPLIQVGFQGDTDYLYSSYVIGHWETFTGPVDADLEVTLDKVGAVAVTIHYKEV